MGLTGRVRQFNAVNPTTVPASHGDRDGVILLRQAGGPPESSFNQLAYRSELGMLFQTDVLWSPDPAHRVTCQSGTCDLASAWLPPDRSSSCQQGKVWINELGCSECEAGECLGSTVLWAWLHYRSVCRDFVLEVCVSWHGSVRVLLLGLLRQSAWVISLPAAGQ